MLTSFLSALFLVELWSSGSFAPRDSDRDVLSSLTVVIVGLTGGFGSGKSSVCRMLASKGAVVINADDIVHQLLVQREVVTEIAAAVGSGAVHGNRIDRKALAGLVFSDPEKRLALESIVHPRVRREINRQITAIASGIVVIEIPLLVESNWTGFDAVVAVSCDEEVAVRRAMKMHDMSEEEVLVRRDSQATDTDREAIATYVLNNSGSMAEIASQVDDLWSQLTNLPSRPENAQLPGPSA